MSQNLLLSYLPSTHTHNNNTLLMHLPVLFHLMQYFTSFHAISLVSMLFHLVSMLFHFLSAISIEQ